MDYSLPGSSAYGILQARILEWVAILFSGGSSQPRDWTQVSCITGRFFTNWAMREALHIWIYIYMYEKWKCLLLSHVWLFVIPWTVACQAPLCHSLLQGILPTQGSVSYIAGRFFTIWATWEALYTYTYICIYTHTHTYTLHPYPFSCWQTLRLLPDLGNCK